MRRQASKSILNNGDWEATAHSCCFDVLHRGSSLQFIFRRVPFVVSLGAGSRWFQWQSGGPWKTQEDWSKYFNDDNGAHSRVPAIDSHYTRAKSQRLYLDLNITKMFQLYQTKHPDTVVKLSTYRKLFCTNFNYSFHAPKKDACMTCNKYETSDHKDQLQENTTNILQIKRE